MGTVKAQNKIKKNTWRARFKERMQEHERKKAFPFMWNVAPEMDRDEFRHILKEQLEKDIISPVMKEHENWIFEGENEPADQLITYIRKIMDRLANATHGHDHPPLRIMIADRDGPYAAVITDAKTPTVVVGTGLLQFIHQVQGGEDMLAAILSHERFHMLRKDKWPDLKNGRPEENLADIFAVQEIAKAGYNPKAMGNFFSALIEEQQRKRSYRRTTFGELLDEHGATSDRVRNTELAIANLQLTSRMDVETTQIPAHVVEAAGQARYLTPYEHYKNARNFDQKDLHGKLRIIDAFMQKTISIKETRERYGRPEVIIPHELIKHRMLTTFEDLEALARAHRHRFAAALKPILLRMLRLRWDNETGAYRYNRKAEERTKLHAWLMRHYGLFRHYAVYSNPDAYERFRAISSMKDSYGFSVERSGFVKPSDSLKALPKVFGKLHQISENFWETEDKAEALSLAQQIILYDGYFKRAYPVATDRMKMLPEDVSWPSRDAIRNKLEDGKTLTLQWERIARMIENPQTTQQEQQLLRRAAQIFKCNDTRITGEAEFKGKISWQEHENYHPDELEKDDQGRIIGLPLNEKEQKAIFRKRYEGRRTAAQVFFDEYEIMQNRLKAQQELLASGAVDWAEMEINFWGFVEKYEEYLEPQYSPVNTPHPFAEEFMKRLNNLVICEDTKWKDIYNSFVTGKMLETQPQKRERRARRSDENPVQPFSIPDLIKRSEEKYFGYATHYDGFHRNERGERGKLPDGHPMQNELARLIDTRGPDDVITFNNETGEYERTVQQPPEVDPSEHRFEFELGIDRNHPFCEALLRYSGPDMMNGRKNRMLSHFQYQDINARSFEMMCRIDVQSAFNVSAAGTAEEYIENKREIERTRDREGTNVSAYNDGLEFVKFMRYVVARDDGRYIDFSKLFLSTVSPNFHSFHDKVLTKSIQDEIDELIDVQVERNRRIDLSDETSLDQLIERYRDAREADMGGYWGYKHYNVFRKRPKLEEEYITAILSRIEALSPEHREEPLKEILGIQILKLEDRNRAMKLYIDNVVARLGLDPTLCSEAYNSTVKAYRKSFMEVMDTVMNKFESGQGLRVILNLLDAVEAQKALTMTMKEKMIKRYGKQVLSSDKTMRGVEAMVANCADNQELRQAFLKYITEPLSDRGTQNFVSVIKKYGHRRVSNSNFLSSFYNPEEGLNLTPEEEATIVDYQYEDFWSAPFEMRTVLLDRILFPTDVNSDQEKKDAAFNQAVTYVLDKVLPLEQKYAKEAREALLVYLDQCPPELRRTTFSAILATTQDMNKEESENKTALRPGQVLSYVLGRTGAAGAQLLQAGHSYLSGIHLDDPDMQQFRDDLKDSKVDFEPPLRWDIFERLDEVMSTKDAHDLQRIGRVLGSGSTAYVVEAERVVSIAAKQRIAARANKKKMHKLVASAKTPRTSKTAMKLMRPQVREIADLQFERYGAAFAELAKRHKEYAPLPSMVDHARDMITKSTIGAVADEQISYAKKLYDGYSVSVNGVRYSFEVAAALSHDEDYIETRRAQGKHLNDLPAKTQKQKQKRRDVALAIETIEMARMLQGYAVDQDRHGGQQKISGRKIGVFDLGALDYDLEHDRVRQPSAEDKKALGMVLAHAMNASQSGGSAIKAMLDVIADHDWGAAKPYLVGVQRTLLARADVHHAISSDPAERDQYLTSMMKAIWATRQIDKDITEGFCAKASLQTLSSFMRASLRREGSLNDETSVTITIDDQAALPKIPPLPMQAIASKLLKHSFNNARGSVAQNVVQLRRNIEQKFQGRHHRM